MSKLEKACEKQENVLFVFILHDIIFYEKMYRK